MEIKRVEVLTWERISLVVPEKQDVEVFYRWVNDIETQSYLGLVPWIIITREKEESLYDRFNKDNTNLTFSIYIKKEKRVIWTISLKKINYINSHTELCIVILDKNNQDKWYWTEAIKLLQKYVFEVLWLNKLYLRYISINKRAWKVYSNLGFKEVGVMKKHNYALWEYSDEITMEIMKEEYFEMK